MKIVFVTPYPDNSISITGGVAGVSYYLVNALRKLDDTLEIDVVSPSPSAKYRTNLVDGVQVHHVPVGKHLPALIANFTIYRWRLFKLFKELNPDIVHFQGLSCWGLNYPGKSVFTVHGIPEKDIMYSKTSFNIVQKLVMQFVEGIARKQMNDVIIINNYVLDELSHQLVHNNYQIANPVEEGYFLVERRVQKPVVLFAGSVIRRKNILGLLEIFQRTLSAVPDAELWIAGGILDIDYSNECKKFISDSQLTERVTFLGQVDLQRMKTLMPHVATLAIFSFQETAPLIVQESMAAGIPVVASRVCGLPYMIRDGENGFLVDGDTPEEAASCLARLLLDSDLCKSMGDSARSFARDNFHPDIVALKTLDVYKSVIDRHS